MANVEPGEPVVRVTAAEGPIDGQVDATMIVPAPAAAVYSALTECVRAPEVFPSLKSCRVIETDPGKAWDIREHKVASWASFLPDMSTVFRSEYVPNRSISFRLLSGDVQHLDGAVAAGAGQRRDARDLRGAGGISRPRAVVPRAPVVGRRRSEIHGCHSRQVGAACTSVRGR